MGYSSGQNKLDQVLDRSLSFWALADGEGLDV